MSTPLPLPLLHPAASRGAYAKTESRRRQILDVAVSEFTEHGYVGGSLRRIAIKAQISSAGILHHFSSKEALLLAALDTAQHASPDTFDSALRLHGFSPALLDYAATALDPTAPRRLLLVIRSEAASPAHPAREWLSREDDTLRRRWTEALVSEHGDTLHDADLTAAALLALWGGLRLQLLLNPTTDVLPILRRGVESLVPDTLRLPCATPHKGR